MLAGFQLVAFVVKAPKRPKKPAQRKEAKR